MYQLHKVKLLLSLVLLLEEEEEEEERKIPILYILGIGMCY